MNLNELPNDILNDIYSFLDLKSKISIICYMGDHDWMYYNILNDLKPKKYCHNDYLHKYVLKKNKIYYTIGYTTTGKNLKICKLVTVNKKLRSRCIEIDKNGMLYENNKIIKLNNRKQNEYEEDFNYKYDFTNIRFYKDTGLKFNNKKIYVELEPGYGYSKPILLKIIDINKYINH